MKVKAVGSYVRRV